MRLNFLSKRYYSQNLYKGNKVLAIVREVFLFNKNLQQLKYEYMEMDYKKENGAELMKLISLPVTLSKRNYRIGDNSVVKKFIL
jgi:hypothetical protein